MLAGEPQPPWGLLISVLPVGSSEASVVAVKVQLLLLASPSQVLISKGAPQISVLHANFCLRISSRRSDLRQLVPGVV